MLTLKVIAEASISYGSQPQTGWAPRQMLNRPMAEFTGEDKQRYV